MSSDVWLGALISVPIGIATGLAVTPVQKWLEDRGKTKALVHSRDTQHQYAAVLFYRMHSDLFTQYLLRVVILTTFTGSAVGILAGFFFAFANLSGAVLNAAPGYSSRVYTIFIQSVSILGQMTAIVGSILIIRYCRPALKLWQQVRYFEDYAKTIPSELRNLDIEAQVKAIAPHL